MLWQSSARTRIEFTDRVAHSDAVDDPFPILVEWSPDFSCYVARACDGTHRGILSLTFRSPEPVSDPIARLRMEAAAIEALRHLLSP